MDPKKVQVIVATLNIVLELRSFLGLANDYQKFIDGYKKKTNPLSDLFKKNQRWEWFVECQWSFEKLKTMVTSTLVFRLHDFEKSFKVYLNASDKAIRGVMMQDQHPVAFESRSWMR